MSQGVEMGGGGGQFLPLPSLDLPLTMKNTKQFYGVITIFTGIVLMLRQMWKVLLGQPYKWL